MSQHVCERARILSSSLYRKTPDWYSANKDMIRSEGNSLEYVRALAHSSVHCYLDLSFGSRRADTKRVQRGGDAIELSTTVVGNNNAI